MAGKDVLVNEAVKTAFTESIKAKGLGTDPKCTLARTCLSGAAFDKIYATPEDRIAAALTRTGGKVTLAELNNQLPEDQKFSSAELKNIESAMKQGALKQDGKREEVIKAIPKGGPGVIEAPKETGGPTRVGMNELVQQFLASNTPAAPEYGGGFIAKPPVKDKEPDKGRTA